MRGSSFSFVLLLPLVYSDVCPKGYTKADGGDCFKVKTFYDTFATQYFSKTFDEAETECNNDGGGLLTSIHSAEENDFVQRMYCDQQYRNIGLKCKGTDCRWDDGSPLNYRRFLGDGPSDDGKTRCYGTDGTFATDGAWQERGCGKQQRDCWVCRVKAKTIDCVAGETEYNGGCVSVYSPPIDQRSADPACPRGGRLISIHSSTENDLFKKVALNNGVSGSIFIGGHFSNGAFQWTDNTYFNYNYWANGFPNTIFGTCVQMLLDAEFGTQGQWTNIDCGTNQTALCIRDGTDIDPTDPPNPKADAHCPSVQYYTGMGSIYSPNYPLSIPGQQSCEYVIGTVEGSMVSLRFLNYNCQSGTSLSIFDGLNSKQPFLTFTTNSPALNLSYVSSSNVMKILFSANDTSVPVGTGWEAEFSGLV